MEFEAISATRMIALMLAGAAFAFAGLYMMLRPRPEGAAKIELFGLKFESSSAGLLVFIVGSAFLAATLFVPERAPAASPAASIPPAGGAAADVAPRAAAIAPGALIREIEPNNGVRDAQPLAIGQVVAGKFGGDSGPDWYRVDFPAGNIAQHEIKLRHVNGNSVRVTLYDSREQEIGDVSSRSGAAYFSLIDETTPVVFLKTTGAIGGWETDTYELSVEPQ